MSPLKMKAVKLLRWSERYTKTDMVYLTKGGAWLTFSHAITLIVGFLASIAFANLLPQEVFGQYKYVLSIAGILAALTLPGLNTALSRASANGNDGSLMLSWMTKLKWGLLSSFAAFGLSLFYYYRGETGLSISFIVVALFLPLTEASLIYYSFLTGKKLFREASVWQSIIVTITNILIIVSTFLLDNVITIVVAYFFSWATMATVVFFKTRRRFVTNNSVETGMVRYGVHLSSMGIIASIATYLDKVLLFNLLGPSALAIFSFATIMPQNIKSAVRNVGQVAFPKFVTKTLSHIGTSIHTKVALATLMCVPVAFIYWTCAPFLFKYLFPQYIDAVFFSQLYAFIIILAPKIFYRTALEARGQKKELYIFQVASSLIKIGLIVICIPLFGILGAVYATLVTEVIVFILIVFLFEQAKRQEIISQEGTVAVSG